MGAGADLEARGGAEVVAGRIDHLTRGEARDHLGRPSPHAGIDHADDSAVLVLEGVAGVDLGHAVVEADGLPVRSAGQDDAVEPRPLDRPAQYGNDPPPALLPASLFDRRGQLRPHAELEFQGGPNLRVAAIISLLHHRLLAASWVSRAGSPLHGLCPTQ